MRPVFTSALPLLAALMGLSACTPQNEGKSSASTVSEASSVSSNLNANQVEAQNLDPTKATEQAKADINKGICQLYAAYGYTAYYPGIDAPAPEVLSRFNIIYIEGTSDTGDPYNQQGIDFAKNYNAVAIENCGAKQ